MSDLEIIKEIEKELGVKLEECDDIKWIQQGFFLDGNGRVSGLALYNNQVEDIKPIAALLKDLPQLQTLGLRDNQISDISFLRDLTQLQYLDLAENQIIDVLPLNELTSLKELILFNNRIIDCNPLENLLDLEKLYCQSNFIENISFIKKLKKLNIIDFYGNPIAKLPPWIKDIDLDVCWEIGGAKGYITFYDNPLIAPPVEIVKQGKAAIGSYFKSLEDESKVVRLNEAKVILVGEGMAGKTSLLKRLQGLPFDKKESQTHGINVVSLEAKEIKGLENFEDLKGCKLHFWDFGGQEIMHASHRFFLSKRALYILVLDSRTDSKKYHWLKHIEKYGGDSPVIVVMNKVDENSSYNVEQNKLNKEFPNIENRFHRISCKKGDGIAELVKSIGESIPKTSLFGTNINKDWLDVRDRLVEETCKKMYLSSDRFRSICEDNNVNDEGMQKIWLNWLDAMGVVLSFEQLDLADIYILDPHWVTIGVYKIINSSKVSDGMLKEKDLDYILNKEKIKSDEYDPAKEKKVSYSLAGQRYIIHIMEEFELCYEYDKDRKYYIIPDLLPKELPNEPELAEGTPLRFIMKYDYLPSSVISRLMLQMKNDIKDGLQWRYGMVLSNKDFGCMAKVKADAEKKTIDITVQGGFHRKREYFSAIRHHLSAINGEFDNLVIYNLIPLPGYPNRFVKYENLLGHETDGRDEYYDGELGKPFSVSEMLDSVISKEDRTKEGRVGDININLKDIGNPKLSNIGNPQVDVKIDIKVELPTIQGEFEDIKDFLAESLADGKEKDKAKELSNALDAVTPNSSETKINGALNKAKRFLEKLADDESELNKMIKGAKKGAEYAGKAGVLAAKIALLLGL